MKDLINYILSKNYLTKTDSEFDCFQITSTMISGPINEIKTLAHLVYLELQK